MLDVSKLHVLTEATMPALTKLCYTVQVELELQKSVGSAGAVSKDLQAVLKEARQATAAAWSALGIPGRQRPRGNLNTSESGASPQRIQEAQVVSEEPAVGSPRLQALFHLPPVRDTTRLPAGGHGFHRDAR